MSAGNTLRLASRADRASGWSGAGLLLVGEVVPPLDRGVLQEDPRLGLHLPRRREGVGVGEVGQGSPSGRCRGRARTRWFSNRIAWSLSVSSLHFGQRHQGWPSSPQKKYRPVGRPEALGRMATAFSAAIVQCRSRSGRRDWRRDSGPPSRPCGRDSGFFAKRLAGQQLPHGVELVLDLQAELPAPLQEPAARRRCGRSRGPLPGNWCRAMVVSPAAWPARASRRASRPRG